MDPEIKVTKVGDASIVGVEPQLPISTDTLVERVVELQKDAISAVIRLRDEVSGADINLKLAKQARQDAARVAVMVGAEKEKVAEAAGVSVSTVSNWVRGEKDEAVPSR